MLVWDEEQEGVADMEIHGNSPALAPMLTGSGEARATDCGTAGSGEAAGERAHDADGARVALSDRAREMLAIKEAVDDAPEVREAQVDDLRAAIGAGTYDVKGQLVAEALARHALVEAVA
jgi:flagellar biosynthesis anti-sigma factor FlgM